jgi:hypothetical protein
MRTRARILAAAVVLLCMLLGGPKLLQPKPPGTLALDVAISADPSFATEWMSTSATHPIAFRRLREAYIGQTVHVAFIVTGHRADAAGMPDLEIDVVVRHPNGDVLFEEPAYARVTSRTGEGGFVLGNAIMDLMLQAGDPTGTWAFEATVHDKRAGTRATGRAELSVAPANSA